MAKLENPQLVRGFSFNCPLSFGMFLWENPEISRSLLQRLVNVPFWEYWTSPYSSHYRPYTQWLGDVKHGDMTNDPCAAAGDVIMFNTAVGASQDWQQALHRFSFFDREDLPANRRSYNVAISDSQQNHDE